MTLATRLSQPHLGARFYCRFRGLPYIFANFAVPSAWETSPGSGKVTLDGETYTWSSTLVTGDRFGARSTEVNAKGGISQPGRMALRFRTTGMQRTAAQDVWLAILPQSLWRSDIDKAIVAETIEADDTTITVDSTAQISGYIDDPPLYVGLETVAPGAAASSTVLNSVARGMYGSQEQIHTVVIGDQEIYGGGPWITSRPMAWRGRPVDVWVCTGYTKNRRFQPYGASAGSSEDGIIFRGTVAGHSFDREMLNLTIDCVDIVGLMGRRIGRELPKARAGLFNSGGEPSYSYQPINETNWYVTFRVSDSSSNAGVWKDHAPRLLQTDGVTPVTEGLYSLAQIERFLEATLEAELSSRVDSATVIIVSGESNSAGGDDGKPSVYIELGLSSTPDYYVIDLKTVAKDSSDILRFQSIWRQFGFTKDAQADWFASGSTYYTGQPGFTADKDELPVFRLPPATYGKGRLYYRYIPSYLPQFDAAPGWTNDAGDAITGYIRIGKEVVGFSAAGQESGWASPAAYRYLTISEREAFGSQATEDVYVEYKPDHEDIDWLEAVQGLAFPDTSVERATLYLMLSGSGLKGASGANHATWDQGWRHCGAYIQADLVDVDAWTTRHARRLDTRDGLAFFESMELSEAIKDELVLNQTPVVADIVDGAHKITLLSWRPALASDATTVTLDHSNVLTLSSDGVELDVSHAKMINRIDWESAWDHGEDRPKAVKSQSVQRTSEGTWGEMRGIDVKIKSIHDVDTAARKFKALASDIFARYSTPYTILALDVTTKSAWLWPLLSGVVLTHSGVPSVETIGRGVVSETYQIAERHDKWRGDKDDVRSRVRLVRQDGRFTRWAPSTKIDRVSATEWTIVDTYNASGDSDANYFAPGYRVRVFVEGNEATVYEATITSVVGNTVTFESPGIALLGNGRIMEFVNHDDADIHADQKKWLYMIDGDDGSHALDNADATTAQPFLWL